MSYTHRMHPLPAQYDAAATEKKWQQAWLANKTYAWNPAIPRADSYVIDTPPPTVSGTLHMGHVFSYTQADFVARYQRMKGKNVFYPMGFDDNGLPTERLVEKTKKIRAVDMSREDFIRQCTEVSAEARSEFRALFESIALSVDWAQEYHTISDASRRLSQLSFLDLVNKGHAYRKQQPMLWDPVDQTAIAQAEVEDKILPSFANEILFTVTPVQAGAHAEQSGMRHGMDPGLRRDDETLVVMTTRPELLPACVALFFHPDDARYAHLKGRSATVPFFDFPVPILPDDSVEPDKGTGLMMCCTFGDEKDIEKWRKHSLPTRMILNKFGKVDLELALAEGQFPAGFSWPVPLSEALQGKKVSNADPKHPGARETVLQLLRDANLLKSQTPITHAVKCAERSGAALELIPTPQWFVRVLDKKEALKARAAECDWNPDWMRLRLEQWIDGLNWDWCISRQRYYGVPFPVWYVRKMGSQENFVPVYAQRDQHLPINPLVDLPKGMIKVSGLTFEGTDIIATVATENIYDIDSTTLLFSANADINLEVIADPDVMDTWATSSISPQLSAGAISQSVTPAQAGAHANPNGTLPDIDPGLRRDDGVFDRFNSLFPADLRPQAHEIIRTWAFYTLVKSHLHNDQVPWKNLMISGWCLAEDKSKMSKSKGNVVTPVALIEERGADAVRYWAATSRLGQDTAFSPDLLKIGKKLVGKLWNATQFAAPHLAKLKETPASAAMDSVIGETLDRWILSRLRQTVAHADAAFARYEYADALDAINQFFWSDFCDNYLELIKKRVYNEEGHFSAEAQQSAVRSLYYLLDGILKLYAPFVPHVTEELYTHIFADDAAARGSLHAHHQWPQEDDYPLDADALVAGRHALDVLELIRKSKSASNRSIKFPIARLSIFSETSALTHALRDWIQDVNGAGNVLAYEIVSERSDGMTATADNHFSLSITFAAAADAA